MEATEFLLRMGTAFIAGVVIGFERESHGRPAGLRTMVLVSVASAMAMIVSESFFRETAGSWRPDPARLAAGVLTGMGFLGAGAIIREGILVRGLTTAALLWFSCIIGITFGAGEFQLGGAGLAMAMIALFWLPYLERWAKNDWYGVLIITCGWSGITEQDIRQRVESLGIHVRKIELDYNVAQQQRKIRLELKYKKQDLFSLAKQTVDDLLLLPSVKEVQWM